MLDGLLSLYAAAELKLPIPIYLWKDKNFDRVP